MGVDVSFTPFSVGFWDSFSCWVALSSLGVRDLPYLAVFRFVIFRCFFFFFLEVCSFLKRDGRIVDLGVSGSWLGFWEEWKKKKMWSGYTV